MHGWDIARATGQRAEFDEAVAEQKLECSRGAVGAIPPDRRPFGPGQQAPGNAPAIERLAALLGRTIEMGLTGRRDATIGTSHTRFPA